MIKIEFLKKFKCYPMDDNGKKRALRNSYNATVKQNKMPVYAIGADHELVRKVVEDNVLQLSGDYCLSVIDDHTHCDNIALLADKVSQSCGDMLVGNRFRIGNAQKVLNLYLKYLWCSDLVHTPPHCPLDYKILDKGGVKGVKWTTLDSIEVYKEWIARIREKTGAANLSEWELGEWNG